MRVLIVKTSSMGDVLHCLPAVTDAHRARPELRFDWLVEEAFTAIPAWHPAVDTVLPVAVRRWRQRPWARDVRQEFAQLRQRLRRHRYHAIIDAQGLIKSAVLARLARGRRFGFDRHSVRESLAALFYDEGIAVDRQQHAIDRLRQLFAAALSYAPPDSTPDYGIAPFPAKATGAQRHLLLLHGTTWTTKLWPEAYWLDIIDRAARAGYRVSLPWGNDEELQRARRLTDGNAAEVLPPMNIPDLAALIQSASAVIGVDSGLIHLAAALAVPSVCIYGATSAELTGTRGARQINLAADFSCAPCRQRRCTYTGAADVFPACYAGVSPDRVWQTLAQVLPRCPPM